MQTTYLHRSNFYLLNGLQLEDFSVEPANCYSNFKVRIESIIQRLKPLLSKDFVLKLSSYDQ